MALSRFGNLAVVVCIVGLMIMTAVPSNAAAQADSKSDINSREVAPREYLWLDEQTISEGVSKGQPISVSIGDETISFILMPHPVSAPDVIVIEADGSINLSASNDMANTMTYSGVSQTTGLSEISATMSKDYLFISFALNGTQYSIESREKTNASFFCGLYSSDDFKDRKPVDMSNDVMEVPKTDKLKNVFETSDNSSDSTAVEPQTSIQSDVGSEKEKSTPTLLRSNKHESKTNVSSCAGDDPEVRVCRIILASDSNLRSSLGSPAWRSHVLSHLNAISTNYESQVAITFEVVAYVDVPTSAIPESETSATAILSAFMSYMSSISTVRDVSHLCSGKDFYGTTLGMAYEQGVGTERWNGGSNSAYSISMQYVPSDSYQESWVMGHELGHNLNGDHAWSDAYHWMSSTYMGSGSSLMNFERNSRLRIAHWGVQTLDISRVYNYGPSSVSSQNLQASLFWMEDLNGGMFYHPPGTSVKAVYSLKNVGTSSITLNYIFVAARDASGANHDFGYVYNVVIAPGSTYAYDTTVNFGSGGTWTLWPAYYYNGNWGPFQWITIQPSMYYLKGSNTFSELNAQNNVCYFYRDCLLSNVQTPVVGSTVWFYFTLYNGNSGTSTNNYDFFFVLCRCGGSSQDFGVTGSLTLPQSSIAQSLPPGGGYMVFASKTLIASGTWNFWPCYKITSGGTVYWGPQIHGLSITV